MNPFRMTPAQAALTARWQQLAPREKGLVQLAVATVAVAALWWLALAPALAVLRGSDAQHQQLNLQLQHMQQLAAQAQALQSQPRLGHEDALRALEASVAQRLGSGARLTANGDRVTVVLKSIPADALAGWLTQARINARALPVEARLQRSSGSGPAAWDGTLVMGLPPRN